MDSGINRIVAGFVLVSSMTYAQPGRSFGLKGGVSFANFWDGGVQRVTNQLQSQSPPVDERSLIWFAAGVFSAKEWIPDFLTTQSELLYSRGGKSWETGGTDNLFLVIDYLQMPAILRVQLPLPFLTPSAYVGPQISWAFRARTVDVPETAGTLPFFQGIDIAGERLERDVNIIDLGFVSGLTFDIPAGPGFFAADFRYQMGFLNAFNFAAANDIRNYSFQIMGGYALEFGGGPQF